MLLRNITRSCTPAPGRRTLQWETCTPISLSVATTPAVFTPPQYTAAAYTGLSCLYSQFFGSDRSYRLGGGRNVFNVGRSNRGVFVTPVLNQFRTRALYSPFLGDDTL